MLSCCPVTRRSAAKSRSCFGGSYNLRFRLPILAPRLRLRMQQLSQLHSTLQQQVQTKRQQHLVCQSPLFWGRSRRFDISEERFQGARGIKGGFLTMPSPNSAVLLFVGVQHEAFEVFRRAANAPAKIQLSSPSKPESHAPQRC